MLLPSLCFSSSGLLCESGRFSFFLIHTHDSGRVDLCVNLLVVKCGAQFMVWKIIHDSGFECENYRSPGFRSLPRQKASSRILPNDVLPEITASQTYEWPKKGEIFAHNSSKKEEEEYGIICGVRCCSGAHSIIQVTI